MLRLPRLRPQAQTRVHRTWTRCEDSDEEAGTAASLDHTIARLQILEAATALRNASDVVINVCSGVVHLVVGDPSNQWSGRPVAFSATGVQSHVSVSLTHVSPGGPRNLL